MLQSLPLIMAFGDDAQASAAAAAASAGPVPHRTSVTEPHLLHCPFVDVADSGWRMISALYFISRDIRRLYRLTWPVNLYRLITCIIGS